MRNSYPSGPSKAFVHAEQKAIKALPTKFPTTPTQFSWSLRATVRDCCGMVRRLGPRSAGSEERSRMKLNGKPVSSGTLVFAPGENGEFDTPFGPITVDFLQNGGVPNVTLIGGSMTLENITNPLGQTFQMNINLPTGNAALNMSIYAIGDGGNYYYTLHYACG
jgi:hypothetical protein